MGEQGEAGKRGYLLEDYRLFHLRDELAQEMEYHYHAFDKIVLQLAGKVTYHVEGKQYALQPYDMLLIRHNLIHRPVIDPGAPYERVVLWLSRDYLQRCSRPDCPLDSCFAWTEEKGFHLLRPRGEDRGRYRMLFQEMEDAISSREFGGSLLAELFLQQLLIALNRACLAGLPVEEDVVYRFDAKMEEVTRYIGAHLGEELSIDRLAGTFYLSRYYLMHRFKEVYGVTIHQYVRQKRLLRAAEEIRQGTPVLKAAMEAGFNDYSAFLRAFRSAYGKSPREWK